MKSIICGPKKVSLSHKRYTLQTYCITRYKHCISFWIFVCINFVLQCHRQKGLWVWCRVASKITCNFWETGRILQNCLSYFNNSILVLTCVKSTLFSFYWHVTIFTISFYEKRTNHFRWKKLSDIFDRIRSKSNRWIGSVSEKILRDFFLCLDFQKTLSFWSIIHSWLVAIRYDGTLDDSYW